MTAHTWRRVIPVGPAGVLGVMSVSGAAGTGLFLTGGVLYYTRVIGLSSGQVGLGLSLAGLCGLAASVPLGRLTDRVGPVRTLMVLGVWRMAGYGMLAFARTFGEFLVTVCLVTMAERAAQTANQAVVGEIFAPDEGPRTMLYMVAAGNVGLSLGALAATGALALGTPVAYRALILGNAVSFVPLMALTLRLRRPAARRGAPAAGAGSRPAEPGPPARPVMPAVLLSAANGLVMLHDSVLFVALPLWISQSTRAPRAMIGVAIVVNTAITALTQVRWNRLARTFSSSVRGMILTGLILAAAAGLIGTAHFGGPLVSSVLILLGVTVLTCGENLHSACYWQISFELSSPQARARSMAVFGLGQAGQEVAGPSLVTELALRSGPAGWLALAVLFMTGAAAASGLARLTAARRGHRAFIAPRARVKLRA